MVNPPPVTTGADKYTGDVAAITGGDIETPNKDVQCKILVRNINAWSEFHELQKNGE